MQRVNNKSDITNQYGKNFQILIGSISTIYFGPCTYTHTNTHAPIFRVEVSCSHRSQRHARIRYAALTAVVPVGFGGLPIVKIQPARLHCTMFICRAARANSITYRLQIFFLNSILISQIPRNSHIVNTKNYLFFLRWK